ncbi:MAG: CapA family protein [Acetobacteraceae bacterium]|nr:CapA family protein [Acetobacteraceae bacterium]
MSLPPMRFVATGDAFITRRLASTPALWSLADVVRDADARFTNFEVLTPGDAFPSAVSGGTWAKAPEGVIGDLQTLGFNMLSWANNHTLDYAYDGLANTAAALDRSGMVHAGVGRNLAEAAAPRYLETVQGRVALIGICSTFHETAMAGQQRPDMAGRPGINPLRFTTTYTLPRAELAALAAMAEASGVNDGHKMRVKAGFGKDEPGVVLFGGHRFKEGPAGVATEANKADVARTMAGISEARRQGDYVLVSLHAHEALGTDKAVPAGFLVDFARACIDAGAHAVIGHGPHVLRGIEMYQKRPIFHSLGNFIFHNETIPHLPQDFYDKFQMGLTENVADAIDKRSDSNTKGFAADPWAWKSVLARWNMEGDETNLVELIPVELGFGVARSRRGTPRLSEDEEILPHLARLSAAMGTVIEIDGNIGRVKL